MDIIDHEVFLFCHVISLDPIIIVGYGSPGPFEPAKTLCEALKDKRVYFLMGSWWSFQDSKELTDTVTMYREYSEKYPNHHFYYTVNDAHDGELLTQYNVPCLLVHQNAFISERTYRINSDVEKKYDAIYNARLDPLKRHILSSKIDVPAYIYYNCAGETGWKYLQTIRKLLPRGVFLNGDYEVGEYKFFSHDEICTFYNASKSGLCLSAVEGAMYASTEYLLSGIPVVSTHNAGGRNFFLQNEFSRIVDPNPYAIRDAVQELIDLQIPPEYIRRETLMRMLAQREKFISLVQSIYDQEGVARQFKDEWDTIYINKMHTWGIPNWQVLQYIRDNDGHKGPVTNILERVRNVSPPDDFAWV